MADDCKSYAIELLKKYEGFRDHIYYCTKGKKTIGYGFNLESGVLPRDTVRELVNDNYISKDRAVKLLSDIVDSIYLRLDKKLYFFCDLPYKIKAVLICMVFQLGFNGVCGKKGFVQTLKYMSCGDFLNAAKEMLDSSWYKDDTPKRAESMSNIVKDEALSGKNRC